MIDDTTGQSGHSLDGFNLVSGRIKWIGSRSGPNGACVQVSQDADTGDILLTNSRTEDPPQRYTRTEWAVLVLSCIEGEEHTRWVAEEIAMLLKQEPLVAAVIA